MNTFSHKASCSFEIDSYSALLAPSAPSEPSLTLKPCAMVGKFNQVLAELFSFKLARILSIFLSVALTFWGVGMGVDIFACFDSYRVLFTQGFTVMSPRKTSTKLQNDYKSLDKFF